MIKKVEQMLRDFRPEHSEFQIENFILGCGTPWGRYKQALRELSSRHPAVVDGKRRIAALRERKERLQRWQWLHMRELKKAERELDRLMKEHKSKLREYGFFYRLARDLKKEIGEITPDRRRKLESEMWSEKARRLAAIDLLSTGGLQRSTVEFITSLPRDMRRMMINDLRPENRQRLLSIIE